MNTGKNLTDEKRRQYELGVTDERMYEAALDRMFGWVLLASYLYVLLFS